MRVLITADLHYNNPRSRRLADELIAQMMAVPTDALLVVGDTATSEGDDLEQCLSRFNPFPGPKLFVAGNHELWTRGDDSFRLWEVDLPRRIRDLGWLWIETQPFVSGDWAVAGTVGWYDYSFACEHLAIPRRFYEHKISPGAAAVVGMTDLLDNHHDVSPAMRDVFARWNDGKFVKLQRSDEHFARLLADNLDRQLSALRNTPNVLVAMHHLPFRQMLPPPHTPQWDFVKAFLGADMFGQTILKHHHVKTVVCGHTHLPLDTHVHGIHAFNVGSGYRMKRYRLIELP